MKIYQTNEIRNISLVGAPKSGKTTLAETMLFEGNIIKRRGTIEDMNTVSDYRDIEIERKNSIYSTVMFTEIAGKKINIIDTPGFDDFAGEVIAALKVSETAVMVVNAQNGVEVGTEITWRYISRTMPVLFVVNQIEHEKANFEETLSELKTQFGNKVMPFQLPVQTGSGFNSVIDIISMKLYKYSSSEGKSTEEDIPTELKEKAEQLHSQIIEFAAESNEALMEKYFDTGTLTPEEMGIGLADSIKQRNVFPLFCISAKLNIGIDKLLNFIASSLPAPDEVAPVNTKDGKEIKCDASGAFTAFVFKTSVEPHLGEMSFLKICSGTVTEGMDIVNSTNNSKERISQIFKNTGKVREKIARMVAGDIGSTIKLKNVATNHTLTSLNNTGDEIEPIRYPEPKYRTAIKATNAADDEKLANVLSEMNRTDPTLIYYYSKELKQMIIEGQGELQINIAKWQIETLAKISVELLTPKIPYRETITKPSRAVYRHKKQSGGAGQFGEVHLMIQPYSKNMPKPTDFPVRQTEEHIMAWGGKLIFNNCIVGGAIDSRFMPAILKGIMEKMEDGPLTGSYVRDISVYIYDGKMHPVDSNDISFRLAGRNAFREAFKNAAPKILEPIYDVEIFVPSDRMGDVITDLQTRRAIVLGMDSEGNYQTIKAKVPLAEMNRYSTALSSISSGKATYSMKFNDYQQVPAEIQSALLKAYEDEETEE